jgi:hypothetical protein
LAALALVALGCGSDGGKDAAVQVESATEEVSQPGAATEASVSGVVDEARSAKQQLKDDSADNKKRVNKGFGNATDDIKRTFQGLGKKS